MIDGVGEGWRWVAHRAILQGEHLLGIRELGGGGIELGRVGHVRRRVDHDAGGLRRVVEVCAKAIAIVVGDGGGGGGVVHPGAHGWRTRRLEVVRSEERMAEPIWRLRGPGVSSDHWKTNAGDGYGW